MLRRNVRWRYAWIRRLLVRSSSSAELYRQSALIIVAIRAHLLAEHRREPRLLADQVVRFAAVANQVVQLLAAIIRRGDELVQRGALAIEHREAVGQEVGLVIRE